MSRWLRLLDNPLIRAFMFHPRYAEPGHSRLAGVHDGMIPLRGDVTLGYRLYAHTQPDAPLIVYFHGNGEIAAEYDSIASQYHNIGAALLIIEYRGYGWSTGQPGLRALIEDTGAVHHALPGLLSAAGLDANAWFVMGRSLGSVPAIQLAYRYPNTWRGLIVESGFAQAPPLFASMVGLPGGMFRWLGDPIGNLRKMRAIKLPLLIIHGEADRLIHVDHGQRLFDTSPARTKHIMRIAGAGHNDLMLHTLAYFGVINRFLEEVLGEMGATR